MRRLKQPRKSRGRAVSDEQSLHRRRRQLASERLVESFEQCKLVSVRRKNASFPLAYRHRVRAEKLAELCLGESQAFAQIAKGMSVHLAPQRCRPASRSASRAATGTRAAPTAGPARLRQGDRCSPMKCSVGRARRRPGSFEPVRSPRQALPATCPAPAATRRHAARTRLSGLGVSGGVAIDPSLPNLCIRLS